MPVIVYKNGSIHATYRNVSDVDMEALRENADAESLKLTEVSLRELLEAEQQQNARFAKMQSGVTMAAGIDDPLPIRPPVSLPVPAPSQQKKDK